MDVPEFERRFLEFVYRTDAPITVGAVAFYAQCPLAEVEAQLARLASTGVIHMEVSDAGDVSYQFPGRQRLDTVAHDAHALTTLPEVTSSMLVGDGASRDTQARGAAFLSVGAHGVASAENVPALMPTGDGHAACPFCGEEILLVAKKCKHCQELLDPLLRAAQKAQLPMQVNVGIQQVPPPALPALTRSPAVAGLLSFLWPGAGQIYCGRVGAGFLWMVGVFLGYCALVVPGLILHVLCIASASRDAKTP